MANTNTNNSSSAQQNQVNANQKEVRKRIIRPLKTKVCVFCKEGISYLDYKDVNRLKKFINERSKIIPRRTNGNCAKHQRMVSTAIKRARILGLLPFVNDKAI